MEFTSRLTRSNSATISCNFKAVPRSKKAAWGNKFIRDHYDLVYDANPESISNRLKKSSKKKRESVKVNE